MAIVTVEVTNTDIKKGQADPSKRSKVCPVYRAAKRVIPALTHVSPTQFIMDYGGEIYRVDLPPDAKRFVRMADTQAAVAIGLQKADPNDVDQEPLKPFKFQLHIPSPKF